MKINGVRMKVTVIGGGSTYTPELVNGFLQRADSLPISELCLMDTNQERLEIVGGFTERMVGFHGAPFRISLTTNQREALQNASYVITQFRVGSMDARIQDEYLGKRNNLIGQETTGVGGMAKALRTIPIVLKIAKDLEELAPKALLINFTNPAGLITEALFRYAPMIASVGVCNVAITIKMEFLERLKNAYGLNPALEDVKLDTLGLNHLSWHRGLIIQGEDWWPKNLELYLETLRSQENPEWPLELIETTRMIPNYYLQYFYQKEKKLKAQISWPPSRGEQVREIEKDLLDQYASPSLTTLPPDLMKRGGAWYSTLAAQLLNSHFNDLGEEHVVNIRHNGAVAGWPADWVLELPCKVDQSGITPVKTEPLPPANFGLISAVKAYELHTVEAAIHGNRKEAYLALLANPLGPQASEIDKVLDEMLETNKPYLPQFWS